MENLEETKTPFQALNEKIARYKAQGEENYKLSGGDSTTFTIKEVNIDLLKSIASDKKEALTDARTSPRKILFLEYPFGMIIIYSENLKSYAVTVHELIEV